MVLGWHTQLHAYTKLHCRCISRCQPEPSFIVSDHKCWDQSCMYAIPLADTLRTVFGTFSPAL